MSTEPAAVPTRAQSFAAWYFRDASGNLVLGQPPNRPIKIMAGMLLSRWALRLGGLRAGSPLDVALERVGRGVLTWWALDELLRGATPYRRSIGAAVLVYAVRQRRRTLAAQR
jgi:hypothetical protein